MVPWKVAFILFCTATAWFISTSVAFPPIPMFVKFLCLVELAFFLVHALRYRVLNKRLKSRPDVLRSRQSMDRFTKLRSSFELSEFLSGWFLGAPWERVTRGNIEELVAYGFFAQTVEELDIADKQLVTAFLNDVEEKWNFKFPEGYDANLKYMQHRWEPLRVVHKPLFVYAITELLAITAHAFLYLMGFRRQYHDGFSCWHKLPEKPTAASSTDPASKDDKTKDFVSSPRVHVERLQHHTAEHIHAAAERTLDVAVAATAAVSAAVSVQYPHEGQMYHVSSPSHHDNANNNNHRDIFNSSSPIAAAVGSNSTGIHEFDHRHVKVIADSVSETPKGHHNHQEEGNNAIPIVFLHGVGFGCLPYLHFLNMLMKTCHTNPFIIVEVPHVALRLCWEALDVDTVAMAAVTAVKSMGYQKACFIGHSYGSFCVSRIAQCYPEVVQSLALLDPVCLLLCFPQLLHNFIYRSMSRENFTSVTGFTDLARFACSRDLIIAQAFCRKFHWTDLMLWPEDITTKSLICLSGQDDLVPSELVLRQFENAGHDAKLLFHEDLGHGGFLLNRPWLQKIVKEIASLVDDDVREDERDADVVVVEELEKEKGV